MRRFPYVPLATALTLARIGTALLFGLHAVVRIVNSSIAQFGGFMESVGFPNGVITVWLITTVELLAAGFMVAGVGIRWAAAVLMAIAVGGIVLIHRHFGWFVGEHGTGGSEFSVALMLLLLVVAAADVPPDGAA
jgi:putative oxidoreductase